MLTTIVNIQPKDSGGGGGETRETIVYRLASEMEEKLPPDYIPYEVSVIRLLPLITDWSAMRFAERHRDLTPGEGPSAEDGPSEATEHLPQTGS